MLGFRKHAEQRTPFSALLRAIVMLIFGHLWWSENVVGGNAVSLRALGWFASVYPPLQDYALPALPSLFQLFITEDFGGLLSTPAMGFVSIIFGILDVIGPAYGWLIRNGIDNPTLWQVGQALVRGLFVSVIAQHIAWVNAKWLWGYLRRDLVDQLRRGLTRPKAEKQPDPTPRRTLPRPRKRRQAAETPVAPEEPPTPAEEPIPAETEPAGEIGEPFLDEADLIEIQWQNGVFMERR
jgi:hypothetical protein